MADEDAVAAARMQVGWALRHVVDEAVKAAAPRRKSYSYDTSEHDEAVLALIAAVERWARKDEHDEICDCGRDD